MFGKEKEPLTFRKVVTNRYKTDTIMSMPATLVVLFMPLIVLGVLVMCIGSMSHLEPLKDFDTIVYGIPFMIELFVIMAIMYQLYNRLCTHSRRDVDWRQMLIQFEDKVGADSTNLRKIDKTIRHKEVFVFKPLIKILMASMFLFDLILFFIYFPQWVHDGIDYTTSIMMIGVCLCSVQAVLIIYSVLTFAHKHEKFQNDFTIQFSADLAKVGIQVPPMIKIVRHYNIFVHILLLMVTGCLWTIYLLFMMFRNMNNHLMNQWVYESELLKVIESNGRLKFESYMPDYHCAIELTKRQKRKLNNRNFEPIKKKVKAANKMPKSLWIAELFMIFLCAYYMLKIIAIDCEISDNYLLYQLSLTDLSKFLDLHRDQWFNLIMIGVQLFFLMTTISSMLGLASRRPSSWRKVVRSCVTFVIPMFLSQYLISNSGLTHIFDLDSIASSVVLAIILVMMVFSQSIREFYAPVGENMPETVEWIKYAFHGDLGGNAVDYDADIDDLDLIQ